MRNRARFVLTGIFLLFLFGTACAADDTKNVALFEKIKGAVWEKVTANANKYRWEITSTIIDMNKEANPGKDAQLKSLDALAQISKKRIEENKGTQDGANYLWLNVMFMKSKQALIENPVLAEDDKKSVELYEKIIGSEWGKVTDTLAKEDGAKEKMLAISNAIVKMVKESQADRKAQMKCAIDLVKINKKKMLENKGNKDYPRYSTLQAIMIKAALIIKQP